MELQSSAACNVSDGSRFKWRRSAYRIIGPVPVGEVWNFAPGAIVPCEWKSFEGGTGGVTVLAAHH